MMRAALLIQRKTQWDCLVKRNDDMRADRHSRPGGFSHVPGLAGLAHSQAPPKP
jgi:hypothetical protein